MQNHYLNAITYLQKAEAGFEKKHDKTRLPNVYNKQAVVYVMIEDYPKAEIYFEKALPLYHCKAPKSLLLANTLSNLGQSDIAAKLTPRLCCSTNRHWRYTKRRNKMPGPYCILQKELLSY
ncbi:MAG: tetratricopeptide repeat protein [Microscillaceae bacterium]|nr:tetratricopeptide repeat protein [Microscillaceae bacterium]